MINVHKPGAWAAARFEQQAGNPLAALATHGTVERGWAVTKKGVRVGRDRLRLRTWIVTPLMTVWFTCVALGRAHHTLG